MKHYHWIYLLGIAAISLVISIIFLGASKDSPVAVPAGLAFGFLGGLSGATAAAVRAIQKRLDILEQTGLAKQTPRAVPAEK